MSPLLITEVDIFDRDLALEGRHRDVGGATLRLLGGAIHHVSGEREVARLNLELLPGLHQLHQRPSDAVSNDPEGKQGADRELVSRDQPDPHHHRGNAGEVAKKFGKGTDGLTADLELEIFTDEAAVAILEIPAGFELGVLGLDRLNAGDGFGEVTVGADTFLHHLVDLVLDNRVGDQG